MRYVRHPRSKIPGLKCYRTQQVNKIWLWVEVSAWKTWNLTALLLSTDVSDHTKEIGKANTFIHYKIRTVFECRKLQKYLLAPKLMINELADSIPKAEQDFFFFLTLAPICTNSLTESASKQARRRLRPIAKAIYTNPRSLPGFTRNPRALLLPRFNLPASSGFVAAARLGSFWGGRCCAIFWLCCPLVLDHRHISSICVCVCVRVVCLRVRFRNDGQFIKSAHKQRL